MVWGFSHSVATVAAKLKGSICSKEYCAYKVCLVPEYLQHKLRAHKSDNNKNLETVALRLFIGTSNAAQDSVLVWYLLSALLATVGCSHADMVPT